ncbi:Protein of unknown function [Klenkia soli]|uniref:DUF2530 domain-containing protein n=1 Tax=Klenkia soli TaxID=1052260 RepID=A0A1H0JGM7_9ACTN|nr:DUF2530 domain-containing protein [Klenkia soli]SDO42918.1 Protein of unknown function [Klenkia soli]
MPAPTRPSPPPLRVETRRVVLVGAALWAIALVVVLVLPVDAVWVWTCVCGLVLAVLGLALMRWQQRS